ncbi:MAG TPA: pentapeptide repeat-containing protein [Fibrobacteraceae bacterium]|nr:pentapeptide repeat-containing protein [Fibrobacteraceae bacterium]
MQKPIQMQKAYAADSEFKDMDMSRSLFSDINLAQARFQGVNFSEVQITAVHLGGAVFRNIGLPPDKDGSYRKQRPVLFENGSLHGSSFRHMDLSQVRISDSNIQGMCINGIPVTEMQDAWKEKHSHDLDQ